MKIVSYEEFVKGMVAVTSQKIMREMTGENYYLFKAHLENSQHVLLIPCNTPKGEPMFIYITVEHNGNYNTDSAGYLGKDLTKACQSAYDWYLYEIMDQPVPEEGE